jgi:hypothetical protein
MASLSQCTLFGAVKKALGHSLAETLNFVLEKNKAIGPDQIASRMTRTAIMDQHSGNQRTGMVDQIHQDYELDR